MKVCDFFDVLFSLRWSPVKRTNKLLKVIPLKSYRCLSNIQILTSSNRKSLKSIIIIGFHDVYLVSQNGQCVVLQVKQIHSNTQYGVTLSSIRCTFTHSWYSKAFLIFYCQGGIYSRTYTLDSSSRGQGISHIRYYPSHSKMLSIVLSDRMFNSLAELYFKAGVVQINEMQVNYCSNVFLENYFPSFLVLRKPLQHVGMHLNSKTPQCKCYIILLSIVLRFV